MDYPKLPELKPDGVIYENTKMGVFESFLPTGGYDSAHAPALLETAEGDLLCAWFAGSREGNADVRIVCSRLPKGTAQWEPVTDISGDPTRSEQNPSLFQHPNGDIWAVYTAQLERLNGKNRQETAFVRRQISRDQGRTWGPAEILFPEIGTFCRQPIQILSNGRWIMSTYVCSVGGAAGDPTILRISDDQGQTWRAVEMPGSNYRVHGNIVELGGGKLVDFLRSRAADNIYISRSDDYGDTWTVPVPTVLPNNNASISALRLQSGRIAIAYNHTNTASTDPTHTVWPKVRCPVAVALSEDGGETFPMIRAMELGEGYMGLENVVNNLRYEYPYLMQARDGRLHLAFANRTRQGIKWMSFTEEDVMGAERKLNR